MMKKSNLLITILLFLAIIILFVSIKFISKSRNNYKNINFVDNQLLAVAFLNNLDDITSTYNDIINNVSVIEYEENNTLDSEELFLIIPRYDININIYKIKLNNDTGKIIKDELIKTINKPFVIKCYTSDTMSNILLEFNYKNKNYEYQPRLSLRDNKINYNDIILDITKYN